MKVFFDACVLYPPLVRGLLIGAAERELFAPFWSPRVLEEWRRAVAAKQGLQAEDEACRARRTMTEEFPDAEIMPDPEVEAGLDLPDPADAHVLAAALAAGADVLLTFNLRDFPRRAVSAFPLEVRHPDGFLWELLSSDEAAMSETVSDALDAAGITPDRARTVLKRARLSRFGKAWEALAIRG